MRAFFESFVGLGGAGQDSAVAARLRAAQIAAVRRYTPWMMAANIADAFLVAYVFRNHDYASVVMLWSAIIIGVAGFAMLKSVGRRHQPARAAASSRGIRRTVLHALFLGSLWAVLPAFFAVGDAEQRIIVASVVAGLLCGGGLALVTIAPAAIVFTGCIGLGTALALFLAPGFTTTALFVLNLVYVAVIAISSLTLARTLRERIEAQVRSEEQRDYIGLLLNDFEEHGGDWIWMTNAHGRLKHVSSRLVELLKQDEASLLGRPALMALPKCRTADSRRRLRSLVAAVAARQPIRDYELHIVIDGWSQQWSLTANPVFTVDGAFDGYRGVGRNVTQAETERRRNEYLARYDVLTSLANRATFNDFLRRACARSDLAGDRFAVLLVDIDHFKTINDTLGHPAGDELLKTIASRLEALGGDRDIVARLGGDEFAIIATIGADTGRIESVCERILQAAAAPVTLAQAGTITVSASVGLALSDTGATAELLTRRADLALYRAKQEGRGRFCYFEPDLEKQARRRHKLECDLRDGLKSGALHVVYQPMVDARTLEIVACEALVRWDHPELGPLTPAEFVPLAEERGLIEGLGAYVVGEACRQAAQWPAHVRVAVNLSPVQFRSPALFASIAKALEMSGLNPNRLEVEITESLFLEPGDHVDATLNALRRLGVHIALDDFGIGYSSLSYLRRYHFDKLKIDKSFVDDVETSAASATIIESVVRMAEGLGAIVAAEGVETAGQLGILQKLGCGQIQGYHISRPVRPAALAIESSSLRLRAA